MAITIGNGVTVQGGVLFETGALAQPWTLVTSPTQLGVTSNLTLNNPGGLPVQYSDMQVSPDGTKLSVWDGFNSECKMYTLNPAYTLGTLPSAYNTASLGSFVTSHYWKPDGTKLLTTWFQLGRLYGYDTTAWFPSTLSNPNVYTGLGSYFSSQITGLYVSNDGTKVFVAGDSKIAYFTLGTAWTPNTASYQTAFSVPGASTVWKVWFKDDGTRMFVSVTASGVYQIQQYNLSSAWDMSTASLVTTFVTTDYANTGGVGLSFSSNGENMFTAAFAANSAVRRWNTNA